MTTGTADSPAAQLPSNVDGSPLISPTGWAWIAVLTALFVVLYRNFLWRMGMIATGEWGGDWSHALIVPLISVYFIHQSKGRLLATPYRVYWPGLVVLFMGIFAFAWCIYPVRNDMLQGYSMIVSLFGLVLFLTGPKAMGVLWFPILYLSLGVKISERIWEQIAWQLQLIAAKSSTLVMQGLWFDVSVRGSTIELTFMRGGQWVVEKLNVAEACSGLRMLMAFIALGAAMAFLVERAWWKRIIMVALAVPIAVLVNVGRVTAVALLTIVKKEMATGDFHIFVGMVMLIPAAGLFMLVGWILDNAVIEESREAPPKAEPADTPPPNPPARLGWLSVLKGISIGAALTLIAGLEYGLLLTINRPEDLFGGVLTSQSATGLFVGGLVLLAGGFWLVRRQTRSTGAASFGSHRPLAMGVAAGVLAAAVLGLNGVVKATRIVLIKQPVPMRIPLFPLPDRIGKWEKEHDDDSLSAEALEALGTRQYLSRVYRDTSAADRGAESMVRLHVAYYTGTPDTVPHVPDRCFVAGGLDRIGIGQTSLNLSGQSYREKGADWWAPSQLNREGVRIPETDFDATIFTFAHPDSPSYHANVVYFFVANGKFLPTPEHVRVGAFDLRDRYSYYCKVEVGLFGVSDPQAASKRASEFLSDVLPEIMACLPDWEDVKAGRWPAQAGSPSHDGVIR